MGISHLLQHFKSIGEAKHISKYKGQTVGIDSYSWLHKSIYTGALKILKEYDITNIIKYFKKKIDSLLYYNIKVVLIFDGDNVPLKREVEDLRKDLRVKRRAEAERLWEEGKKYEAEKLMKLASSISPQLAKAVIDQLLLEYKNKIEVIVAPYEADSQLAYLNRTGYVDFIISEDSDLLVFGAPCVLTKLDRENNGIEMKVGNIEKVEKMDFKGWSHERFIQLCILAGCDYLISAKGIAFKKAHQLLKKYDTIENVLQIIKKKINEDYYARFMAAFLCFRYQRVYCPRKEELVHLNPLDLDNKDLLKGTFEWKALKVCLQKWKNLDFLGKWYNDETAYKVANSLISPCTKEPFMQKYTMGGKASVSATTKKKKRTSLDEIMDLIDEEEKNIASQVTNKNESQASTRVEIKTNKTEEVKNVKTLDFSYKVQKRMEESLISTFEKKRKRDEEDKKKKRESIGMSSSNKKEEEFAVPKGTREFIKQLTEQNRKRKNKRAQLLDMFYDVFNEKKCF